MRSEVRGRNSIDNINGICAQYEDRSPEIALRIMKIPAIYFNRDASSRRIHKNNIMAKSAGNGVDPDLHLATCSRNHASTEALAQALLGRALVFLGYRWNPRKHVAKWFQSHDCLVYAVTLCTAE